MRALTGAVFVLVLVGCILWRFESFALLFLSITVLGLWEFYGLAQKDNVQPQKITGIIAGTILFIAIAWGPYVYALDKGTNNPSFSEGTIFNSWTQPFIYYLLPIPFLFLVFIAELYRKKTRPFANIAYTLLGVMYVALPFALLTRLPAYPAYIDGVAVPDPARYVTLGFLILMWTSDTGAYLCGRAFGKTKLFERISPKKTWEGSIGGGLLCIGTAFLLSSYWHELEQYEWITMAILIVIGGNLGDLTESMFKRSIDIKDSGTILPGHGGILDRFDAVLLASPFVFTFLYISRALA